jgi:putative membrane protein
LTLTLENDNLAGNRSLMKTMLIKTALLLTLLSAAPSLMAAENLPAAVPSWHAQTLLQAVGNVLLFAAIGIATAIIGFKIFDKCTPGHLTHEILEHRNVAAAIIGGAVIIGVCIIVAASMLG